MAFDRTAGNGDPRAGVFGRVPDALGDPLTTEQVKTLPHGTEVIIVWSGGNGPHHYWIWRFPDGGATYARSEMDDEDDMPRLHGDPITFIGSAHFHTRVWVVSAPIGPEDG